MTVDRRQAGGRVHLQQPAVAVVHIGQRELDRIEVGVEEDQEVVVHDLESPVVGLGNRLPVEEHHQRMRSGIAPRSLVHERPTGLEPGDLAKVVLSRIDAGGEVAPAAEHRMSPPDGDQSTGEVPQFGALAVGRPVHPRDLVVLAVGVVVALLGARDLVAVRQHRDALREHERGQEVALLPEPQRLDRLVVGRALDTTVPRPVVRLTVLAVLAVRRVAALVVGDEVAHREAVMAGDEVH